MKIIIDNFSFEISEPYAAGQVDLTLGEAQALNTLRADRVRELVRKRISKGGKSQSEVETIISEVDAEYSFKPKREGPTRVSRLEVEIAKVAEEQVRVEYSRLGRDPEGPEFESLVLAFMDISSVRDEAERRLETQRQVASDTLEDLLADAEI